MKIKRHLKNCPDIVDYLRKHLHQKAKIYYTSKNDNKEMYPDTRFLLDVTSAYMHFMGSSGQIYTSPTPPIKKVTYTDYGFIENLGYAKIHYDFVHTDIEDFYYDMSKAS